MPGPDSATRRGEADPEDIAERLRGLQALIREGRPRAVNAAIVKDAELWLAAPEDWRRRATEEVVSALNELYEVDHFGLLEAGRITPSTHNEIPWRIVPGGRLRGLPISPFLCLERPELRGQSFHRLTASLVGPTFFGIRMRLLSERDWEWALCGPEDAREPTGAARFGLEAPTETWSLCYNAGLDRIRFAATREKALRKGSQRRLVRAETPAERDWAAILGHDIPMVHYD